MARKVYGTGLDLRGSKVLNSGDASLPTDLVTLQQVQAWLQGLSWKQAVRAASTGNVSLTAPGASMDGVTLTNGDRILLKNQTTGSENGIYVWNGASSALTRANDADTAAELKAASVVVAEGATFADKSFTQTADGITLGTTALVWVVSNSTAPYTAGNGISITGTAIAVVAGTGIIVDGSGVRVDPSVVTRKFAQAVGTGAATTVTVTHGLGSTDVTYSLRVAATGEIVDTDVTVTDANTLTLSFATAPANGELRITVVA